MLSRPTFYALFVMMPHAATLCATKGPRKLLYSGFIELFRGICMVAGASFLNLIHSAKMGTQDPCSCAILHFNILEAQQDHSHTTDLKDEESPHFVELDPRSLPDLLLCQTHLGNWITAAVNSIEFPSLASSELVYYYFKSIQPWPQLEQALTIGPSSFASDGSRTDFED